MESRITELEIKLAYAEDLLEQLNLTVFRQQQKIEVLERAFREMRQQMAAAMPAEPRSLLDEIPPHY